MVAPEALQDINGFHLKEAGWWPFSSCGWFFASPRACLEDIVKDVRDAAHFTAHVAGMIHTRSAKAWAEQAASRSAEALDQSQNALHEITRVEAWQNSAGPCAGVLLLMPMRGMAVDVPLRRMPDFL
ncbi:unnamed protein product [Symbiodinium natans]|uniref:Uncharacterized protein n=1 Tax=Symbiodinium natans TaxID=878477 RepID=A0A812ID52_9DINO|nr:unnamed protein product [Symbiodinium natans]